MTTFFDVVTVTCFAALMIAFFQFTERDTRTLWHFILAGVVLGIANQVGNAGQTVLALAMVIAAAGYAILMTRR